MNVMSNLRVTHWLSQVAFISALVAAGMPQMEAEYFNMLLEEEGIRRREDPQRFAFRPCEAMFLEPEDF